MTKTVLGIIGGSVIYDLPDLEKVRSQTIKSPWGEPSAPLRIGEISGLPVVFLSRHDKGHVHSPSDINYRANIDVLKRDLGKAFVEGGTLETAAGYLLRTIGETAKMAVELGLLTAVGGKYTVDLYFDDADGGGIERELARTDNLNHARSLHRLLCVEFPGRQVLLRQGAQAIGRGD